MRNSLYCKSAEFRTMWSNIQCEEDLNGVSRYQALGP